MNSSLRYLEAAAAEDDIEALDEHRETAFSLVKALSDWSLDQAHSTDDIRHLHQELVRLAGGDHGGPAETLITVVGSMGTGKSTAINALLDEARLLPTSGYDACTSVATEVRYNHSADPDEAYRAEITFITAEELLNEVLILREDVLSASEGAGGSSSAADDDDEDDDNGLAEIAWDKIRAVWPHLTRAELAAPGFDIRGLLEDPLIRVCVGGVHQVCHSTAAGLCRELERFIANRDNAPLAKRAQGACAEQQLWPLVDKVNIFIKAEVLSTGAVIRDMPGGQDGNFARSSRAAANGDKCDHLCVLVPIKRAISEQIVKKPFNDSSTFKNWIKFDGRLGDITYVCTMTDDAIEIERDAEAFDLVDHLEESKRLEEELDAREAALANQREQFDILQVKSQVLEDTVGSRIKPGGDRRKRTLASEAVRGKRPRRNPPPSPSGRGSHTARLDPEITEDPVQTLTSNAVAGKAEELTTNIQCLEANCERLQRELLHNTFFLRQSCIQARNALTRSAIRRDFVHAAKELLSRQGEPELDSTDQELYEEARPEPEPPMVHTVSARGYFDSLRRHRGEQFWSPSTVELSGIPAWRDHIRQLTVPARRRKCQAFLKAVLICFNQLAIWCDNGSGISLTPEQEKHELTRYKRDLDLCVKRLGLHFDAFVRECRDIFCGLFLERVQAVLPNVVQSAIEVASRWPSRKRGDQLLTASSYRAACRKGGVYEGKGRVHRIPWNLNEELVQPLIDGIDCHWNNTFVRLLPAAFRDLKVKYAQVIYDLSDDADQRMHLNMTESARQKLRLQARAQIESFHDAVDDMRKKLVGDDTPASVRKQLETSLKHEMGHTWRECVQITGAGSFQRQQDAVDRHLRYSGAEMYTRAASRVERILSGRCNTMAHTIHALKDSVDKDMWHAYTTSIVAKEDGSRATREELRKLLVEADGNFQTS